MKEKNYKIHTTTLYSLIVVLIVVEVFSFIFMTSKVDELNTQLEDSQERISAFESSLEKYENANQDQFSEIARILARYQSNFEDVKEQVSNIQSDRGDFSGVIEETIVSVVTIVGDRSIGTGFIISDNGYIVTNEHVIRGSNNIEIVTSEKESIVAELVGYDRIKDIALLKINGSYNSLELVDSTDLQIGKQVIAIGTPLGLTFSVTQGIISGLDRVGPNGLAEYIQTDVPLNPGNSGGPLIDTQGKVVGINNFKIGDAENLGFALESNAIKESVNNIANQTIIT